MAPPETSSIRRARLGLALVVALGAAASVQAFYLISPLSYWPVSPVAGNTVFDVNLVAAPPNIPNPPLLDGSATWNAAFIEQLNAWNAVLPDTVLVLQADAGSGAAPAQGDGKNDVVFSSTVYGDTWGSSTLGICLSMWSGNRRTEADILFNSTKTWNAYTGNLQGGTSEFRRVALHELGHALLLDHPDDVGQSVPAIMNSQASNADVLTTDDRAGVLAVFGGLTPVTFIEQPRQMVTTPGGQFLLNVTATGSEPLSYQWQRSTNGGTSWADLAGFTFPNGSASGFADGNLFRVVVTNPLGSVNSRPVMLTVTGGASGPSFGIDPLSATINQGGDVIFAASASGSRMPTYQWQYSANGGGTWSPMFSAFGPTDVAGTTGPTLRITNTISAMNGYQFRCVATNPTGSATSAAATLTVHAGGLAPYFTWQPRDVFATAGTTTLVPAGVSGSPMPSLQWQISLNGGSTWSDLTNGGTFTGVTTATLSITSPDLGQNGALLRLNATNGSGSASSRAVMLSVRSVDVAPGILDEPDDVGVDVGEDAVFSTRLHALPAAVYQWEYSSDGVAYVPLADGLFELGTITLATVVAGANTRTLTLAGVDDSLDQFRFRLLARNEEGSDTSVGAVLTIGASDTAPAITTQPQDATVTYTGDPSFTVAASGSPAPTIQWQISTNSGGTWGNVADNGTFSGATSTTLTLTNPTVAMSGHRFRVVATNSVNSATSQAAILTVNPAAASVTLSDLERAYTGAPLAPAVTVSPPLLAVDLTYDGSATAPSAVGSYAVVATVDDANYTGSASGTFTIVPGITPGQTGTVNTVAGGVTVLSVTANTGTGTAYQWQVQVAGAGSWADIAGATSATYTIPSTQEFQSGNYRVVVTLNGVFATSAAVALAVQDPPASAARLLNLSTRALCLTGDDVLIPGFYLDGAGTKRLLLRAVGPELTAFGVPGALADPQMVLKRRSDDAIVASNEDWGDNANWQEIRDTAAALFAFGLQTGSKSAALLLDLPAGGYTIVASGHGAETGVSIVELYDVTGATDTARLVNISNRGFVGVGGNIMIPGFVVSAEGSRTFLIRAVGPTLSRFNVQGVLADPRIDVYKRRPGTAIDDLILTNDTWGENGDAALVRQTASALFAFSLNEGSADAAFVVTLPPGQYTVNAKGVADTTGVALVEVYLVP